MKYLIIILFCFLHFFSYSQEKEKPGKQDFKFYFGKSIHFTGDVPGIAFNSEYSKAFKKRLSLSIGIGGTIHNGSFPNFYTDPNGNPVDGSIRNTTAGFQINGHVGYSPLTIKKHEFLLRLGTVLRYQASSLYDQAGIYYPIITGLPIPVIDIINYEPQKIYTIGASGQIMYSYSITQKIIIGALAGYQFDTNGDNISQLSIFAGIRF